MTCKNGRNNNGIMTTGELSMATGYSVRAIQEWCMRGELGATKHGRDYAIEWSEWQRFIADHPPQPPRMRCLN